MESAAVFHLCRATGLASIVSLSCQSDGLIMHKNFLSKLRFRKLSITLKPKMIYVKVLIR